MKNCRWILAFIFCLPILGGCSKTEDTASAAPQAAAPVANEVPAVGRSAAAAAIASHLENGGEFYAVVDIKEDLQKMGDAFADAVGTGVKTSTPALAKVDFRDLFKRLGFYDIAGGGASAWHAANDPYYHNRFFLYTPAGRTGLLKALGGAPGEFIAPGLAPANADLVAESTFDLKSVTDLVLGYVKEIGGPDAAAQVTASLTQPLLPGTALTGQSLIDRLNTRVIFIARADPAQMIQATPDFKMPMVDFVLALDGFADVLDQIQPMLASLPVQLGEKNGMKTLTAAMPIPDPFATYQPMIVADPKSKRLYLVSRPSFADETIFGQGARLATSADYKAVMEGLPTQGNSLSYLSKNGGALFSQYYKQYVTMVMANAPGMDAKTFDNAFSSLMSFPHGAAAVRVNLPDGVLIQSYTPSSPKSVILMAPVMAIALSAAVAIPAAGHVREASVNKAITNNLRQIAMAASQYMLDKGVTQVRYSDLKGSNYLLKPLQSFEGESYDDIVIRADSTSISVTTADGTVVKYDL